MIVSIFGNGPSALQYHEEGMKADVVVCCNYGQKGLKGDIYFIQDKAPILGWANRESEPECKTVFMSKEAFAAYNNLIWREKIKPWNCKVELFEEKRWPFTSSGLHAFLNIYKYCPEVTRVNLYGMDCFIDQTTYNSISSPSLSLEARWMLETWVKNWWKAFDLNPVIQTYINGVHDVRE
jgi:hypothetical protein